MKMLCHFVVFLEIFYWFRQLCQAKIYCLMYNFLKLTFCIFFSLLIILSKNTWFYILWGQFLPRPSVALVVIFGLESPTLEGKPSSSCVRVPLAWYQTSGTLQPLVHASFYCGDNFCLDQVLHLQSFLAWRVSLGQTLKILGCAN